MYEDKETIDAQMKAGRMLREAGITITDKEERQIVVSDFDLGCSKKQGAQILELLNTKRVGVRLIVLFPFQTLPEHYHEATMDDPGKEETVRLVSGTLYTYIPGDDTIMHGFIPQGEEEYYTVRNEVLMGACDQLTLEPGTKHWFQAGEDGAVMYTFTSYARDKHNIFTNPGVKRGCVNELD